MKIVTLTQQQLEEAGTIGTIRTIRAQLKGRRELDGEKACIYDHSIEGCFAEKAVAVATGKPWYTLDEYITKVPGDVGVYQVRSTKLQNGSLIVHLREDPNATFILVIALSLTQYKLVGWALGSEAQNNQFWREDTGRPAFFVPQSALHSIDLLKLHEAKEKSAA